MRRKLRLRMRGGRFTKRELRLDKRGEGLRERDYRLIVLRTGF